MRDTVYFVGKGLLITCLLIPLGLMFLITKGLIWLSDHTINLFKHNRIN
jgi:hypothetical protein